jgi:hydroxyacylglutathione hydrolase
MTIEIKVLTLGIASTNCYIIGDTESKEAVVIDPVDQAELLFKAAQDAGWTIKLMVATHGHFDHVLATKDLKAKTAAPFYIHHKGEDWLREMPQQGLMFTGKPFPEAATPDRWLTDDTETLSVGAIHLETIYTPGHSPDHLCFYMREQGIVFSGDCLFAGSIGRTDLPGGDFNQLMRSIIDKLLPLEDETVVLSGHMDKTTIGTERATNPFIAGYDGD